jgi:hypothetical protein
MRFHALPTRVSQALRAHTVVAALGVEPDCTHVRALLGASSAVASADGRYLYSAAFASNAVGVFKLRTISVRSAVRRAR